MATRVSDGDDSADRYRSAQSRVTRALARDMRRLRRLIVPSRLQATVPDWIDAVRALIGEYGGASATLAADYYEAQREAANIGGSFTSPLPDPPPDRQVDNSLRWAAKDVWSTETESAIDDRLNTAEVKSTAVAQKLVADQGRAAIRESVQRDREAVGYARAAALGACAFCRLMASRGMVYKTAGTAGRDANSLFTGDASVAKFHDNCHCGIIPVFRGQRFELSAHAREWDRLYQEYAAPFPGDQLRRFRRAIAEHG